MITEIWFEGVREGVRSVVGISDFSGEKDFYDGIYILYVRLAQVRSCSGKLATNGGFLSLCSILLREVVNTMPKRK